MAYKQQNVFLTVAEAGRLRSGRQHGWGLVRALFRLQVAVFSMCPSRGGRGEAAL